MTEVLTQPEKVDVLRYKNARLPVEERVKDLLRRMTLEEKVAQMLCIWKQKDTLMLGEDGKIDWIKFRNNFKNGLGQITRLNDTNGGLSPVEMARMANAIQKFFVEETRLGIPVVFHVECLHGLVAKEATSYPQPIGLASTFNPELIEEIYTAIARDTRERGAHQVLAPVVDVARDPRWGRVEETYGEDPYLISKLGTAAVRGLQGDGRLRDGKHVIATLKHFAAHGQPESGSNCGPGNFSERILRDVFLYPFKTVLKEAGAISVMPSYNEIDGLPSHANTWLLKDVLRDEWGFDGYLVSDYFAITELNHKEDSVSHAVAKDKKEAAVLALKAGVNIELPDMDCYPYIPELVREGAISEGLVDKLVAGLLKYKFQLGLFENPYVEFDVQKHDLILDEDRIIALRAAEEVITLLKNEGNLLPFDIKKQGTIAVIGPNADRYLLGGYSGQPVYYTTVLKGIREKVQDKCEILYGEGCKITVNGSWDEDAVTLPDAAEDTRLIEEAVTLAQKADQVILVLGGNEQTSREAWSKVHLGDRTNLDLIGRQNDLVKAVLATGKPVVVVLFNGRPNAINYIQQNVPAILECWYLGQEAGRAVANVLFGEVNPSGKLPISIPRSVGHIPCYYNHKPSARRGYLFEDINPLFPFGFGLSYTTFKFDNLRLEKSIIRHYESTQVLVDVTNTGKYAGQEVVQMYIRDEVSSVTRPVKELKGFRKISLAPGEMKTVELKITPESLSFTNVDKKLVVEPGDFTIMVGNSSRDVDLIKTSLRVI
jgi:beta-glucosidase